MTKNYDTIIIGAGHNGLVTACYLAKAGQKVLVLESRDVVGGAAATEELFPGFKMNVGADHAHLFRKEIIDELGLTSQGLNIKESSVVMHGLNPDGPPLTVHADITKTQKNLSAFSQKDSERYTAFCDALAMMADMLRATAAKVPVDPMQYTTKELLGWLPVAKKLRGLGKKDMPEFLRVLPMGAYDYLNEWFENDFVKGVLGSKAVTGSQAGPRSSGTMHTLLYMNAGVGLKGFAPPSVVEGGIGNLSNALVKKAESLGATVQTSVGVSNIIVQDGTATGVVCDSGDKYSATRVVSNADPFRTFFDLVGPEELGVKFVRDVRNIKFKGTTAKLNLALKSLPDFGEGSSQEVLAGTTIINPSLDYLERAYDETKYGRYSTNPYLSITIPSILDPSMAPDGQHVMSVNMQFAPFHLREGNWEDERDTLANHIIDTISSYCPKIRELILHQDMATPLDLQNKLGLTGGSIFHGQMGLDQVMFMRPVAGCSNYGTPVENLYLCGAGSHPGGGLTGAPGYNAAKAILAG